MHLPAEPISQKLISMNDVVTQRRGINSVEVGIDVLRALQEAGGPATLGALSASAKMPASKVHRYLASYIRTGLVHQSNTTRRYELGPFALNLGLAALRQLDVITLAGEASIAAANSTGMTSLMTVWSGKGPVIVRWTRGMTPMYTSLSLGSVLPPLYSATGQVFLSHLPQAAPFSAAQSQRGSRRQLELKPLTEVQIEEVKHKEHRQVVAWVDGRYMLGIHEFACPVLDCQGNAAVVLTLVSATDAIADPKHPATRKLVALCAGVSEQANRFGLKGPRS